MSRPELPFLSGWSQLVFSILATSLACRYVEGAPDKQLEGSPSRVVWLQFVSTAIICLGRRFQKGHLDGEVVQFPAVHCHVFRGTSQANLHAGQLPRGASVRHEVWRYS